MLNKRKGEKEVSEVLNPESFVSNNFAHLDVTPDLPEKRKSEFFKDFDCLESTNNRVSRQ